MKRRWGGLIVLLALGCGGVVVPPGDGAALEGAADAMEDGDADASADVPAEPDDLPAPADRPPPDAALPDAPDVPAPRDVAADGRIDAPPDVDAAAPDARADVSIDLPAPDVRVDAASDVASEPRADALADAALDVAFDARPDALADAAPDARPDAALDIAPDARPDAGPDARPDAGPDATLDVAPDARPDAAPDVAPDVPVGTQGNTSCALAPRFDRSFLLPAERPPGTAAPTLPLPGCYRNDLWQALYYRVAVGPGQTVVARTTTGASFASPPLVQVLRGCAAEGCLAASPTTGESRWALWTNRGAAATEVVVQLAFSYNINASASVPLQVDLLDAPASACAATPTVVPDGMIAPQMTAPGAPAALCTNTEGSPSAGPAREFRVTIPAGSALRVLAESLSGGEVALALRPTCNAGACVGFAEGTGATRELYHENTGAAPREVVIAVATTPASAAGAFTLRVLRESLFDGACPRATAAGGVMLPTATMPGSRSLLCGGGFMRAQRGHVRRSVPAGQGVLLREVRLTGEFTGTSPAFAVRNTCEDGDGCLALDARGAMGGFSSVYWPNPGAGPRDVVLDVGPVEYNIGYATMGEYQLPATPNNTCATSLPTTAPFTQGIDTYTIASGPPTCAAGRLTLASYRTFTVPPGYSLAATAVPQSLSTTTGSPTFALMEGCAAGGCLSDAVQQSISMFDAPARNGLRWANRAAAARSVVLEVSQGHAFDYTVELHAPPVNGTCAAALPLTAGTPVRLGPGAYPPGERAASCDTGAFFRYAPWFFTITVPARQWLRVRARGASGSGSLGVEVLPSCAAATALACQWGYMTTIATTADWQNASDVARPVVVVAGPHLNVGPPYYDDAFDLTATLSATAP